MDVSRQELGSRSSGNRRRHLGRGAQAAETKVVPGVNVIRRSSGG
jgi:hypothetical protein